MSSPENTTETKTEELNMEFINGFFCGTLFMSLFYLAYAVCCKPRENEDDSKNEKN